MAQQTSQQSSVARHDVALTSSTSRYADTQCFGSVHRTRSLSGRVVPTWLTVCRTKSQAARLQRQRIVSRRQIPLAGRPSEPPDEAQTSTLAVRPRKETNPHPSSAVTSRAQPITMIRQTQEMASYGPSTNTDGMHFKLAGSTCAHS
jgi:hypothetical protein